MAEDRAPSGTVDGLLARAARRHGDRVAVRGTAPGSLSLTFAELDAAADRWAAAIQALIGSDGQNVALASPLDPAFAAAFHGIVRSGNVVVPVNPLLRAGELRHLLGTTRARLAVVTDAIREELRPLRAELPYLGDVVLLGEEWPQGRPAAVAHPADTACLHFTSGTTGLPKAAVLSHANLLVNAGQIARAHALDDGSVTVNHLPKYHLMHLNSALSAGATQVLCPDPDPVAAVRAANTHRATHYYSIPVRLNRLAADARLPELALDTVRLIASGGSALGAASAAALRDHFRIPVIQGYGLAETSPLTHSDGPRSPRPGSVGTVVEGTECRIVDPETGRAVPVGERGEVQVRGPQVMRGYLEGPSPLDAEGWLATGDIGRVDEDGYLFLVDRIKDVFKCDNYLVSPAEVERALSAHPAVADCAVVDLPDPLSGAVAAALVVLADPAASLPAVVAEVNAALPYYQHVRHAEPADAVPRSANGKIERRQLREELMQRRAPVPPRPGGNEVSDSPQPTIAVTKFTVKADTAEFEQAFKEHAEFMRSRPGFQRAHLVRSARTPEVYVNVGYWDDTASYLAVLQSEEFRSHLGLFARLADVEPFQGPVVSTLEPGAA
ncbi:AMP-binding protein [Streptomyces sp. NPDC023838]|uniref:AMP-binding protein n=1 Tax=Streptomyces sp. NPDC023838 TaxID=3154325 RepID=UPI003405B257